MRQRCSSLDRAMRSGELPKLLPVLALHAGHGCRSSAAVHLAAKHEACGACGSRDSVAFAQCKHVAGMHVVSRSDNCHALL